MVNMPEHASARPMRRGMGPRFRELVQQLADVIVVCDADASLIYVNAALESALGYAVAELAEAQPVTLIHPDDLDGLGPIWRRVRQSPRTAIPAEFRVRHKDGSWRWFDVILTNRLDDPVIRGIVVEARDATGRKAIEAELEHRANHDPLTGLPNRTFFMDRLRLACERAGPAAAVAVLFLDLDGFKLVNDSLGHEMGDALLAAVGGRLRAMLPAGAILARFGGDEFAVLMTGVTGAEHAVAVAEAMVETLRAPFDVGGRQAFITATIGISTMAAGRTEPAELLREADTALYAAKADGRAVTAVYRPEMRMSLVRRLEWQAALHRALEGDELRLHFQPQVRIASGQLAGVEALVRWAHPELGMLPPAEFVGLAEESGLIVPMGRWVVREACAQAGRWAARGVAAPVSVNLSARQLHQPDLVADIIGALDQSGLAPSSLALEFSEDSLMSHGRDDVGVLRALKELGVGLAIDDFGVGYSALADLHRLPVDSLKIDRALITGLDRDPGRHAIVRGVTTIGHELGLAVAAEGVETAAEASHLRELGVDLAQGFYFAPPLGGPDLATLLANGGRLPAAQDPAGDRASEPAAPAPCA